MSKGNNLPSALTNEEKVSAKDKLLLINENKSNNFGVKSNNELFKQALVEGVNRRIDKTIEKAKKIEQIEEMARDICKLGISCEECTMLARKTNQTREQYCKAFEYAKRAYNAGYRKQSDDMVEVVRCKDCVNRVEFDTNKYHCELTGYYCGTMGYCSDGVRKEMKGGEE